MLGGISRMKEYMLDFTFKTIRCDKKTSLCNNFN